MLKYFFLPTYSRVYSASKRLKRKKHSIISKPRRKLDDLPQDLLINILSRLPVKTLVQCTCISKSWQSLITSPTFTTSHLSHSQTTTTTNIPPLLIIRTYSESLKREFYSLHFDTQCFPKYQDLDCPFQCHGPHFRVVGSCNGLFCLSDDVGGYTNTIILWNPTIKKSLFLPRPCVTFTTHGPYHFVLGFGFDSCSNDYKVVRLSFLHNNYGVGSQLPPIVEVYSVSTGFWRGITALPPLVAMVARDWNQALLHGAVHWIAFSRKENGFCHLVLLFDMGDEEFRTIKLPDSLVAELPWNFYIAVFGGLLSVLNRWSNEDACSIWVMKDYGNAESWTKQYNVDLGNTFFRTLGLRANGELLLAVKNKYSFREESHFVSYNPKSKQINSLEIRGIGCSFYVNNFIESLVLLKEGKGGFKEEDLTEGGGNAEGVNQEPEE